LDQPTGRQIVAASNNRHKIAEIRPLLEPDFHVLSLEEIGCFKELAETEVTLEGNSLQKATYVYEHFHMPCFADDTGLEAEALSGAPGVFSARYAGDHRSSEDNIALLLKNLEGKPNRNAQFRTVITLIGLDGIQQFEGVSKGVILTEGRGTGGFGYDAVFQPEGFTKSMAEMTLQEKNLISHRSAATKKLIAYLKNYYTC
jgi:XTP/dITP diphosphohydrolase